MDDFGGRLRVWNCGCCGLLSGSGSGTSGSLGGCVGGSLENIFVDFSLGGLRSGCLRHLVVGFFGLSVRS